MIVRSVCNIEMRGERRATKDDKISRQVQQSEGNERREQM